MKSCFQHFDLLLLQQVKPLKTRFCCKIVSFMALQPRDLAWSGNSVTNVAQMMSNTVCKISAQFTELFGVRFTRIYGDALTPLPNNGQG